MFLAWFFSSGRWIYPRMQLFSMVQRRELKKRCKNGSGMLLALHMWLGERKTRFVKLSNWSGSIAVLATAGDKLGAVKAIRGWEGGEPGWLQNVRGKHHLLVFKTFHFGPARVLQFYSRVGVKYRHRICSVNRRGNLMGLPLNVFRDTARRLMCPRSDATRHNEVGGRRGRWKWELIFSGET